MVNLASYWSTVLSENLYPSLQIYQIGPRKKCAVYRDTLTCSYCGSLFPTSMRYDNCTNCGACSWK